MHSHNHRSTVTRTIVMPPIPILIHIGMVQHKKHIGIVDLGHPPKVYWHHIVHPMHVVFTYINDLEIEGNLTQDHTLTNKHKSVLQK